MSFPPLNRNQAENEQFNTRQLQETADIGDDLYIVDSPDNSFAFDPQVFMEQLGIRPTEAEEHEPVQHRSEEENHSGDASVDADDALSDDLTNALHLDTSAVPTTSIGIPESAARGSPHSSLRSGTMSLALPDDNVNTSAMTDKLKVITMNTTSIPPPESMENEGQPTFLLCWISFSTNFFNRIAFKHQYGELHSKRIGSLHDTISRKS